MTNNKQRYEVTIETPNKSIGFYFGAMNSTLAIIKALAEAGLTLNGVITTGYDATNTVINISHKG